MLPVSRADAEAVLRAMGQAGPDAVDLTAAALACSIHEHPEAPSSPALDVLQELIAVARASQPQTVEALAQLLFARFGFEGDAETYDDPANADLRSVLVRRRGLPVALGVVWRHVARALGLPLAGTNMPGHFVMRMEAPTGPVLVDVFQGGAILDRPALEQMARQAGEAGLTPKMIEPVPDVLLAIRLQTNLAARARVAGELEAWERAAWRRALLLPSDPGIQLEHAEAAAACGLLARAREAAGLALATAHTEAQAEAARRLLSTAGRRLN